MEQMGQHEVYRIKLDKVGRIRLPADLRQERQFIPGMELLLIRDGNQIQIKTQDQALRELQEYFCKLAPPDVIMSEELIAERRAEFQREQAESARD
jgi:bifunctional DNA-binding transcriptional regulator/antitoxin component of YhaV-PrlF toxin-antitoxin module